MKSCANCEHGEVKAGICCPVCNATLGVMALVVRHWTRDEMSQLREVLREGSVVDKHREMKERGAVVMAKVLWTLIELAKAAKITPDILRSKVCDEINREIAALAVIEKYEATNGPDSYANKVAEMIGGWVAAMTGKEKRERKDAA